MTRFAFAFAMVLSQPAAAQTLVKEFAYQGRLSGECAPGFDNGHLITYDTGGRITPPAAEWRSVRHRLGW